MQIGIAGIGKMGAAIAQRLIEVGHKVTVWNRSADKLKPVTDAGATAVATPAALADGAEAIITILTDAAAIDTVYNGASGLLTGDVRGKLFIEMSTVQPQTEVALAEQVRAKGAAFVECPVGGSTGPARQGKLIGLMGAAPADAARAKPILDQLCRRLEHCGPVGSGAVMKLTINMPLMIYWQALGEALALCRPLGLDPARIMDLLSDTSGGPNVLKVRGAGVAAMLKGGDGGPVTFDVDSAVKDLRTMLAEGKQRGVALPLVEQTLAWLRGDQAERLGRGGSVRGLGLLGQPRKVLIRSHSLNPTLSLISPGAPMSVTLAQASTIVDTALKKGRDTNCAPLTVAVLDAGGHLVAFKREDKSGLLRFDIAFGKAWGALGMGFGSRTLAARAAKTPQFFTMLAAASEGRMVTNPGGVLIRTPAGDIIGAVGISGDTSDKDEACAIAGIEAAGLKADPGQD
jgi:3-hydroxyisobutyrate dehydrogenase